MQAEQHLRFGPYRLDLATMQLWRGTQAVNLPPKVLTVLCLLAARAGQVVTKEELFQTVWSDTVVGDDALTSSMQELRQVLHDNARKPRYIETVHRRGYRFLGKVVSSQPSVVSRQEEENQKAKGKGQEVEVAYSCPAPSIPHAAPVLVGREADLTQLHHWLAKALHGERQLVFVTGEPGIGKTTLVESFLYGLAFREQEESQKSKFKTQKSKLSLPHSALRTPQLSRYGWVRANALNTTAPAKPICQCWKP